MKKRKVRFFCIIEDKLPQNLKRALLLKKSCEKKKIEFILIEATNFDFTKIPKLGKNDLLYRATPGNMARMIEKYMINKQCKTIYKDNSWGTFDHGASFIIHEHNNLPSINTIPIISRHKKLMKKYVKALGGFPIILKIMGFSRGMGIIKVDSMDSLMSLVDYLIMDNKTTCVMRSFVKHSRQGRLLVLGKKVIASYERTAEHDFRSNVRFNTEKKKIKYSKKIEQIAIKAVNSLGVAFGGVDLLLDQNGSPYIAEVNTPCDFTVAQKVTGIEISGLIVDYLLRK